MGIISKWFSKDVKTTTDIAMWLEAVPLACPNTRWHRGDAVWVSRYCDPCKYGDCDMTACHNYKKQWKEPKRLVVVVP